MGRLHDLPVELVILIISHLRLIDLFAVRLAGSHDLLQIVRSRCSSLKFRVYCSLIEEEARQRWPEGPHSALAIAAARGQMSLVIALLQQGLDKDLSLTTKAPDLGRLKTRAAWELHTDRFQRFCLLEMVLSRTGKTVPRHALQWAAECGQDEVVQYFLNLGTGEGRDIVGRVPNPSPKGYHAAAIHLAAANGHASTVRLFLRDGVSPRSHEYHAFTMAAQDGHNEVLRVLLENGVDLQNAYDQPEPALVVAARAGQTATVRFLAAENAPLDEVDSYGNTALHYAATKGDEEAVRSLVEQGADVQKVQRKNRNSLDLALLNGHPMTAKVLAEECTRVHDSTLSTVAAHGDECCVRIALKLGASRDGTWRLSRKRENGVKADFSAYIKEKKDNEKQGLGDGLFPAIHEAAANFQPSVVSALLEAGESVDKKTWNGLTPLHFTALGYKTVPMAKHLVSAGAAVDPRDDDGWTPLHFAALNGDHLLIESLVLEGADIEAQTQFGQRPLHLAGLSRCCAAVDILVKQGANTRHRNRLGKRFADYAPSPERSKAFKLLKEHSRSLGALWDRLPPSLEGRRFYLCRSPPSKPPIDQSIPRFLSGDAYPFTRIVNPKWYLE